jgi:DNA topoisomerase-1
VIQPLGITVIQFLEKYFDELFNYDYTKNMEQTLDKIAKGEAIWYLLCKECHENIELLMESVKDESKFEIKIDEMHSYIIGKNGPVVKCIDETNNVTFSQVKENLDFDKLQNGEYTLKDIIEPIIAKERILGMYNEMPLILKKGKYGLYICWGDKTQSLKEFGNQPIESITLEDVIPLLEKTNNNENETGLLREISASLSIRKSKRGDYIFFKSSTMKKPSFFSLTGFENETNENYLSCNLNILKLWIKNKYGVY